MSYLRTDDGVRLRVSDRGTGPRAVVLVHGWKHSHRVWDTTVAHLAGDLRVVSYDLRGMGESEKPKCEYDFLEHAGDLRFLLEQLELEDATLVGWSMGCSVSLEYMRRYGDRVGRVVLLNGPIRLTQAPDFPWSMTEEELHGYIEQVADGWPAGEREFVRGSLLDPSEALVDWIYGIAMQTPLDVALAAVRNQALLDHRDVLPEIEVPVLAMYSRHDPYYPIGLADFIAERAPRGEKLILDASAHCAPIEEGPAFRAALVDFVARTRA